MAFLYFLGHNFLFTLLKQVDFLILSIIIFSFCFWTSFTLYIFQTTTSLSATNLYCLKQAKSDSSFMFLIWDYKSKLSIMYHKSLQYSLLLLEFSVTYGFYQIYRNIFFQPAWDSGAPIWVLWTDELGTRRRSDIYPSGGASPWYHHERSTGKFLPIYRRWLLWVVLLAKYDNLKKMSVPVNKYQNQYLQSLCCFLIPVLFILQRRTWTTPPWDNRASCTNTMVLRQPKTLWYFWPWATRLKPVHASALLCFLVIMTMTTLSGMTMPHCQWHWMNVSLKYFFITFLSPPLFAKWHVWFSVVLESLLTTYFS